jgi:hypothetical protein
VLEEVRADVQREAQRFARDDGRVVVPARTWVAWATP